MTVQNFNTMRHQPMTWSGWNTNGLGWNTTAVSNNMWTTPIRNGWNTLPQVNRSHVQPTMVDHASNQWRQLPITTGMTGQLGTVGRTTAAAPSKSPMRFQAPVNLYETECDYNVVCELPGCSADSIELTFENGTLIVKGSVNTLEYPESARHILTEYSVADYYRELTFESRIVTSDIKADFRNGLLIISLPKQACSKTTATSVAVA